MTLRGIKPGTRSPIASVRAGTSSLALNKSGSRNVGENVVLSELLASTPTETPKHIFRRQQAGAAYKLSDCMSCESKRCSATIKSYVISIRMIAGKQ